MISRDFNKSNKDYFAKNKIALLVIGVFLLVGIVITAIFGMNRNFEFKGCNEFSVQVSVDKQAEISTHKKEIANIVNAEGGKVDTISISGEGDYQKVIVRYMNDLSSEVEINIENKIVAELGVTAEQVSDHVAIAPTVKAKDYVYTIAAVLLVVVVATLFAYFRYNGASALAIVIACSLGTLAYISIGSILRLTIGLSYFAMIAILNMLIVYLTVNMFEIMREESWLATKDYTSAITSALKKSKLKTLFITIAMFAMGVLFAIVAPTAIKYISLNILFLAVTLLAVVWYVVPFVWSVFVTKARVRLPKQKESKKEIEEK